MKFKTLLLAASIPLVKVIIVTLVGSFIALDRISILNEDAMDHLNKVAFYVFTPALVYANLAKTLTLHSLVTLWFMPLNIFITFVSGSILGWLLIRLTRAPSHLRGLILGCCSAGNLGNMLVIIIPAICKEKGSPFGDQDVCLKYGMAYASLSMAIGSIYLWLYVYNIMRVSSSKMIKEIDGSVDGMIEGAVNISSRNCCEPQLQECSISEDSVDR
ncbi:Auxin efflux carrier-like protein, partial [Thalictrum thalictroides]